MNKPVPSSIVSDRLEREKYFLSFPEGQDMVKGMIDARRVDLGLLGATIRDFRSQKANSNEETDWFWDWALETKEAEFKKLTTQIHTLEYKLLDAQGWKQVGKKKGFDLDRIRAVPVSDIIGTSPSRNSGNRWLYRCPLHNEDTASFTWYVDQNRWHCYGCQQNGDVIALVMLINDCDFVTACRMLENS